MSQKPLLYVEPTRMQLPFAPMQKEYHSMNTAQEAKFEDTTEEEVQQADEEAERPSPQKFNQMTLEEKIDYLIPTSKNLPALYCKLTVNQSYYRGIFLAKEDDQFVFEERQTRKRHIFKIADIRELKIISF